MTSTNQTAKADIAEIRRVFGLLFEPGQVTELRVLKTKRGTVSGYFDDLDKMARAAASLSGKSPGVYATLNPVNPDLLSRAANRVEPFARDTTLDSHITRRRFFPIDFDAGRPAGISSTDEEHAAAIEMARECRRWLTEGGWPEPILADSGNGAHLLYQIDLPAEDERRVELGLKALAEEFSNEQTTVDTGNFNPARIWKVYGTLVAKGDSLPERPHRIARILEAPETFVCVPVELIDTLIATIPEPQPAQPGGGQSFDLETFISQHGLQVAVDKNGNGRRRLVLEICPFNPAHNDRSACIFQWPDGRLGFKCHHPACADNHWRQLRELLEPDAYSRRPSGSAFADNRHDPAVQPDRSLPIVEVHSRQLRDISDDLMQALNAANQPPKLFNRGSALARIRADADGRPLVDAVNEHMLANRATAVTNFIKTNARGQTTEVHPPQDVLRDLLNRESWPFPPLRGIIETPILRPDGSLCDQPGYDIETGLFYYPDPAMTIPPIPSDPTPEQIDSAVEVLEDILCDFPFVDESSRANGWASFITPPVRHAIAGQVPAALVDATRAGSGKTLLASTIATVATGRPAAVFPAPKDDEEWRKQITSSLRSGATVIMVDNLEGRLDSPSLARALTAPVWADRVLATNDMIYLAVRVSYIVTGNNITLGGDMPRRCYLVRLDARVPRPWERPATGFRHPRLSEYVAAHRGEIVAAILTLARGWFAAGKPEAAGLPAFGSYEEWVSLIGGILAYAGVNGFLGNLVTLHDVMDEDTPAWSYFFGTWFEVLGDKPVQVKALAAALSETPNFREAIPDYLTSDFNEMAAGRKKQFQPPIGKSVANTKRLRVPQRADVGTRRGRPPYKGRPMVGLPGIHIRCGECCGE